MIYFPILGAIALATGTMLEKAVLIRKKVNIELYQTASFLAIIIVMVPLLYFFWRLDPQALEPANIFVFSLIVIFSTIANLLVFYSMKWEKVTNLEPAKILEPLFIILLAVLFSFFADGVYERNLKVIIPALIAGSALVFAHIEKHHLEFNNYFIAAIFGSFFFAAELVMSRLILDFYSPISFYFLRCSAIFLISLIIFRPNFSGLNRKVSLTILLTGAVWVVYRVVVYYGYIKLGIVFTTLMIMLGPIFVYAFAHIFLKEKLSWKNITASIIIVACILYAILI